jgi:hypothetical protein
MKFWKLLIMLFAIFLIMPEIAYAHSSHKRCKRSKYKIYCCPVVCCADLLSIKPEPPEPVPIPMPPNDLRPEHPSYQPPSLSQPRLEKRSIPNDENDERRN